MSLWSGVLATDCQVGLVKNGRMAIEKKYVNDVCNYSSMNTGYSPGMVRMTWIPF